MNDYKIVARAEIPPPQCYGKWQEILTQMGFEQAVKIEFTDTDKANRQRSSLLGCFRSARGKFDGAKLKTRLVRQSLNVMTLYAWKERK